MIRHSVIPSTRITRVKGFFAAPGPGGEALKFAGIQAVGIANNVNYGAAAITASVARLNELGLGHTGAGVNHDAARAPAILERKGMRVGIMQRTAVYWLTNHEATKTAPGVAAIKCHTAYQLPFHKLRPELPPCNRPGIHRISSRGSIHRYLQQYKNDIAQLRSQADVVVVSCHWGLSQEIRDYMTELAHAAIDAGADIVMGHGPHDHWRLKLQRQPVFYGLGSFSFHTGHGGIKHGNWVGMLARITLEDKAINSATFQFVRHNESNETVLCELAEEKVTLEAIKQRSAPFNVRLTPKGDQVSIDASN